MPAMLMLHMPAAALASCCQIAKAQGAWVATTCSGKNAAFVTEELGADLAIDYTKQK
jgi:NADPH-dependent curcumin reductase CurA